MCSIETMLGELVKSLGARHPSAVANAADLFQVGEWHVGFEMLSDNIYDQDIALTAKEIALSHAACEVWKEAEFYYPSARFAAATLAASGPQGDDGRYTTRVMTLKHCSSISAELHSALQTSLDFPSFYGKNWAAFWDSITGLVPMPHILALHGWDILRSGLPDDARHLLRCLTEASTLFPKSSAAVELYDGNMEPMSFESELALLEPPR